MDWIIEPREKLLANIPYIAHMEEITKRKWKGFVDHITKETIDNLSSWISLEEEAKKITECVLPDVLQELNKRDYRWLGPDSWGKDLQENLRERRLYFVRTIRPVPDLKTAPDLRSDRHMILTYRWDEQFRLIQPAYLQGYVLNNDWVYHESMAPSSQIQRFTEFNQLTLMGVPPKLLTKDLPNIPETYRVPIEESCIEKICTVIEKALKRENGFYLARDIR